MSKPTNQNATQYCGTVSVRY